MKVLFIGDIVSKAGRRAVETFLPKVKKDHDFIIANAENITHGRGTSVKHIEEMLALGIDCFTGGNHSFDNSQYKEVVEKNYPVLRPYNFPDSYKPYGESCKTIEKNGKKLHVISLLGNTVFKESKSPFDCFEELVVRFKDAPIFIDFHAEMTSEKNAFPWFVDGRAAVVVGTHTHIPSADAKVLPKGTGMITDVGMTGAIDSVIGVEPSVVIARFRNEKKPFEYPESRAAFRAVSLNIQDFGQRCLRIEQIILEEDEI